MAAGTSRRLGPVGVATVEAKLYAGTARLRAADNPDQRMAVIGMVGMQEQEAAGDAHDSEIGICIDYPGVEDGGQEVDLGLHSVDQEIDAEAGQRPAERVGGHERIAGSFLHFAVLRKSAGRRGLETAAETFQLPSMSIHRTLFPNRYHSGPPSHNFDGHAFFNPGGTAPRGFADLMRWQFSRAEENRRHRWPARFPSPFPPNVPERRLAGQALRVTMVGHATLLIQAGERNILTDPVWSERVSPLAFAGPARVNAPGIRFEDLPPIDTVLLTHNHYDHMDVATLARLKAEHDPLVVTPLGNQTILERAIPGVRCVTGNWGEAVRHGGLTIHFEPAHHWSARGMGDRSHALWAAFMIETAAGLIYHVGDTGFHGGRHYREVRARHGAPRLAILPFGAYEPRWFMADVHQNPAEAVEGFALLGAAHAAGHHWATFQLTNEAVTAPRDALHAALDVAGIDRTRFRPMLPGETFDVPA